MAKQDQLEIISPGGEVTFVNLDPSRGISNIGRHPENDIVINSPSIGLFHAVLDHRKRPFNIVMLSAEGDAILGGLRIQPNLPTPLNSLDTLQLGGFTIITFEGPGLAAVPVSASAGAIGS